MVGTDIVFIKRIGKAMEKPNFLKTILTESEIEYVNSKSKRVSEFGFDSRVMTAAGLFAGKEAVLKALGVGITNGYGFFDVVISHDRMGAPVVSLSERLRKVLEGLKMKNVFLSISHDGDYATATAVLK